MSDYRSLSLWLDQVPGGLDPRAPLNGDIDVDVAIIGGGFSGLWTAYYLTQRMPDARVAIVERDICGFGASGRNGGWCVGELSAGVEKYAKHSSASEAMRLARAVFGAVDEVGRVAAAESIRCAYERGGAVYLARNAAQAKRQIKTIEHERSLGFTEDEIRLLSATEATELVAATDVRSGIYFAPAAAIDPARLVRGLADVVERRGVTIYEQTAAVEITEGSVTTSSGTIRADFVVRATEGYTSELPGERRSMVPLYSLMVATEPLAPSVFDEIGLTGRPTFADDRYAVIYGQRTEDDRMAFGGRGVPYLFGSRIDPNTERHGPTHELVSDTLVELFPALADSRITHRWGGVLGAPRNWTPSVCLDRSSGIATMGGYVGEGVCAANLAGQTMAELIVDASTSDSTSANEELTSLPWVNVQSRKWEPEPLRWLGVWGTRRVMRHADGVEYTTDKQSKAGQLASQLL
jgi:glycine/D-amino acid oxidase-like deaminating enzyme